MCGFAGWIDWDRNLVLKREIIKKMGETLTPRGPDESGTWVSASAALEHRRLVVIDPEGGKQPMVRNHGGNTFVLAYNGELYNAQELKEHLESRGHVFYSRSDTEVLLVSFIEWGCRCVEYLNGIFAFAVWDEKSQELFLARDHLGVKPLFYCRLKNALLFASEIKAILANPLTKRQIDKDGLAEIFAIGPARTPGCAVFKGIEELKPGHSLLFNRNSLSMRCYWKLESCPHEDDVEKTAEKIRNLFEDSVKRQMVSDVPVCTLLSGGLDSSAITVFAAEQHAAKYGAPLHTYSIDYIGNDIHFRPNDFQPESDEPSVKIMSSFLGTIHHRVVLNSSDLSDSLEEAVAARDLPGMADIDSSLLLFSKEIKKEATVALSGECADEIFGGYPWFHRKDAVKAKAFPWSLEIQKREAVLLPEIAEYCRLPEYAEKRYLEALEEVPRLHGESPAGARLREISYLTLTRWMPVLLERKDRMSMAAGLEIRVPFCDYRLVEYMWNVPWEIKTHGGLEKGIFRRAMKGMLPARILYRKKSPYPKTFDPKYEETIKKRLAGSISNPSSPLRVLLNKKEIEKLMKSDDFKIPWFGQLMRLPQLFAYLLQVEMWIEKYGVSII